MSNLKMQLAFLDKFEGWSWFVIVPSVLYAVRKIREQFWGKCTNKVRLDGKVVVITGANSGIGLETARELASRGAIVVLACRNMRKAEDAARSILSSLKNNGSVIPMELDVASFSSIHSFVTTLKLRGLKVSILINNAGISLPKRTRLATQDGIEIHFGTNHLGHFLLTNLMLPVLEESAPSRVICVASTLHHRGRLDFDTIADPNADVNKKRFKTSPYCDSKLANVYFARELAKRVDPLKISVFSVCPGWVYTNILHKSGLRWYHWILMLPAAFYFLRTPRQGCQTLVYCATEPNMENQTGQMFRDCRPYKSPYPFIDEEGRQLWDFSQELLNK